MELGSHKRQREDSEILSEAKKPRLEDPLPSAKLEEALSDISDDPDEILNREDIVSVLFVTLPFNSLTNGRKAWKYGLCPPRYTY